MNDTTENRNDVQHLVSGDSVWVQFGPKQRKAKLVEKLRLSLTADPTGRTAS